MARRSRHDDDSWGVDSPSSSLAEFVRPMTQLAAAPAKALLYGLDAMAAPIRSMSRSGHGDFGDDAGSPISGAMAGLMPFPTGPGDDDQDLSGDDVKIINYSIVFTKPDYVCTLQPTTEAVVDYSTDGGNFAAMRISRFTVDAMAGRLPRPEGLDDSVAEQTDRGWAIRESERRYITLKYHVVYRVDSHRRNYERDDLKIKREVVQILSEMRQRLG